ncbi:hypothetical protein [Grimontia celer]|uniref:hypothetical protein n=1 Tax=Grimontia celer TaxID=1796497 RepID=UPI000787CEEB|nr:hypothetical protein [Grimontia celer]
MVLSPRIETSTLPSRVTLGAVLFGAAFTLSIDLMLKTPTQTEYSLRWGAAPKTAIVFLFYQSDSYSVCETRTFSFRKNLPWQQPLQMHFGSGIQATVFAQGQW